MKQEFNDIDAKLSNENELLVKMLNMKTNQEKMREAYKMS